MKIQSLFTWGEPGGRWPQGSVAQQCDLKEKKKEAFLILLFGHLQCP